MPFCVLCSLGWMMVGSCGLVAAMVVTAIGGGMTFSSPKSVWLGFIGGHTLVLHHQQKWYDQNLVVGFAHNCDKWNFVVCLGNAQWQSTITKKMFFLFLKLYFFQPLVFVTSDGNRHNHYSIHHHNIKHNQSSYPAFFLFSLAHKTTLNNKL